MTFVTQHHGRVCADPSSARLLMRKWLEEAYTVEVTPALVTFVVAKDLLPWVDGGLVRL